MFEIGEEEAGENEKGPPGPLEIAATNTGSPTGVTLH